MDDKQLQDFAKRISSEGDRRVNAELIPAATVVLLRDGADGMETLMLRKNSKIAFAGMWVFPGGKIDAEDGVGSEDMTHRARFAAAREAMEEASLEIEPQSMCWFSHWTPPALGNRRFATWFFAAMAPRGEVRIDEGEITESQWVTPRQALAQHRQGEIELVPPTYVTLHYLALHSRSEDALAALGAQPARHYATHIGASGDDLVAMWDGDAGYESGEADTPGPRHRLRMGSAGFEFDDSAISTNPA
jgi:8-oxo-dGTP pyrophosphatase MutT (NUDIX family)